MTLRGALLAVACLLAPLAAPAAEGPAARIGDANIVVILIDTLRADHLPVYGYGKPTAPFLSRLAERGVVFENAHSTSSWTAPATASLFTSLYPVQHGVTTGLRASWDLKIEVQRVPQELDTLAEFLKRADYRTFAVASNLNISRELDFDQGFDFFANLRSETADVLNARVVEWEPELRRAAVRPVDAYDSEIRFVDTQIRRLSERLGWHENTLLVVLSDYGEEFGDHGGNGHGKHLHSEVLDVPFIVSYPDLWPARRVAERVSLLDLLPTLADLLGEPLAPHWEGRSLAPLLAGRPSSAAPRGLYAHLLRQRSKIVGESAPLQVSSLIRGDWKLIRTRGAADQLYDLAADPREQDDRIERQGDVARELGSELQLLERHLVELASSPAEVTLTPEEEKQLRALGYID